MGKVSKTRLIFGVILYLIIMYIYFTSPDIFNFRSSMNTTKINVSQGSTTLASVKVEFGFLNHDEVSLEAVQKPPYIHIYFKPDIMERGSNSVSKMIISADKEAYPGEYTIPILISSANNYRIHEYDLKLNVLPSNMSTMTESETSRTNLTEVPTIDTKTPINLPDLNLILTLVATIATIFGSYIGYKQYKENKKNEKK